jgi:hypothetical protein
MIDPSIDGNFELYDNLDDSTERDHSPGDVGDRGEVELVGSDVSSKGRKEHDNSDEEEVVEVLFELGI